MSNATRALIVKHWQLANTRQWDEFAALLAPDLAYEVPQTREYIDSGVGYLEMFKTWPGEWQATVKELICEPGKAVCVIDFRVGNENMMGISVFQVSEHRITNVTDYWPEPYEPPPRETVFMQRYPSEA